MGWGRSGFIASAGIVFWMLSFGPLRPYRKALLTALPPQMVLVLGGDVDREDVGARLARELNLPLLVSGGSNPEYASWLVEKVGIPLDQVKLDYQAKDTLSNFTSLVDDLYLQGIQHVLVVTSEDHLSRAMLIGNVIAGSRAIRLTGISVSCFEDCNKEGFQKSLTDFVRAWTWVATGRDLKTLTLQRWPNLLRN